MSSDAGKGVISERRIARGMHFRGGEGGMKAGAGMAGGGEVKAVSTSMRRAEMGRMINSMGILNPRKMEQSNEKGLQGWMDGAFHISFQIGAIEEVVQI